MNGSEKQKFGRTSLLNLSANGVRVLLSFLTTILASRGLGPAGMGSVSLIVGYTTFLCYLLTLGFDNGLTFYVAKYDAEGKAGLKRAVLRFGITASAVVGMITMVIATFVLPFLIESTQIEDMFWPALLLVYHSFFFTQGGVIGGFLRGAKIFVPSIVREQILFPVVTLIGMVLFVRLFGLGTLGFSLSYFCAAFVSFSYIALRLRQESPKLFPAADTQAAVTKVHFREWLKFSLPLSIMSTLEPLLIWTSVIISGWYLPVADVGIFSVCLRLSVFVQFLSMALVPVFASYMAELYHAQKTEEFKNLYQTVLLWSSKWVLLVGFLLIATADYVLKVFGPEYSTGAVILALMLPGAAIEGCLGAAKQGLVMTGRNGINVLNLIGAIGVNIVASLVLIPRYGAIGSSIAFSGSFILLNLVRVFQFQYFTKIPPLKIHQLLQLVLLAAMIVPLGAVITMRHWAGDIRLTLASVVFVAGLVISFWGDRNALFGRFLRTSQPG